MKALLSKAPGGPETLQLDELPTPEPGSGHIRIDVKACSINYPDVLIIEDKYQFKPPRPFAPGSEVAGIVSAVGEGVTDFAIGDRVAATTGSGGLSEQVLAPVRNAVKLPEHRGFEEGASLLLTYGTTMHALVDRGQIKAGETLLVMGAAGGTGLSAVELGKAFGARVVAAVSSEEKAQAAREAGADETIVYGRAPFSKEESKALADQFKAACPDGYDLCYDPVGGDYCEPAVRAMGWEGRYLVVGFPAGIPKLALNLTLLKSCDIRGVFWGAASARDPQMNKRHFAQLFQLWDEGKIAPKVTEVFPFEKGGEAIAKMAARGAIGKLVVKVAD